jgi:hypothetical protein
MKTFWYYFAALPWALMLITQCGCVTVEQKAASPPASTQASPTPGLTPRPDDPAAGRDGANVERAQAGQETQPSSPVPTAAEVQAAVARVYKDAVVIDKSRGPYFFSGDLNGDGSQDLVVVVRPGAGMLAQLNSEIANWVIEDPQKVFVPDLHRGINVIPRKPPPERVGTGDTLLAVIHGYGKEGWRDPRAMQTYLLKNVAGGGLELWPKKQVVPAGKGDKSFPAVRGDVLRGTFGQDRGFVYWSGGDYALYKEP